MVDCSNCGETGLDADQIYCPVCGAELPTTEPTPSPGAGGAKSNQSRESSRSQGGATRQRRAESETGSAGARSETTTRSDRAPQPDQQSRQSDRKPTQQQTGPSGRQSNNRRQSGARSGADKRNQRGGKDKSSSTLLGGSSRRTSEPDVNDMAWTIGWNPLVPIGLLATVFLGLGMAADLDTEGVFAVVLLGAGIGTAVWYWGVKEVNDKYAACRNAFFGRSAKRAESRLGIDKSEVIDTFDFRSHGGSSLPLVEPSEIYRADHMVLSDVSVSVDKNSKYNMKKREAKSTGTTKNIYYDNIESITTNDESHQTYLRIVTSQGENLRVATVDQRVAEDAQGRLRSKMRDVKRAGR